jgi:hypothetical protein
MHVPVAGPTNRFLIQQRDRRWPRVLSTLLLVSAVVLAALSLVGWPRLRSTAIRYDLIRLRGEVDELRRQEHRLATELEVERSPERLATRARALGLTPPDTLTTRAVAAAEAP